MRVFQFEDAEGFFRARDRTVFLARVDLVRANFFAVERAPAEERDTFFGVCGDGRALFLRSAETECCPR